jgi:predicted transcriptional regulator
MARAARDIPPPLELLCLRVLWERGRGSVKDVHAAIAPSRPLAYTTIMTVLERLVKKGRLTREKSGRAFLYAPTAPRDELRRKAVQELLDDFFDGNATQLLAYLQDGTRPESPSLPDPLPENVPQALDTTLL